MWNVKAWVVTTTRSNWVVGYQAFHGSIYDGHDIETILEQAEQMDVLRTGLVVTDTWF